MNTRDSAAFVDRRSFVGAGVMGLGALTAGPFVVAARAQEQKPAPAEAKKLAQIIAEYVAAFDLRNAPPEVARRARIAFIDTMGVMLAGSREEVAHIVLELVKAEGATPAATIVGQSLRASPQLAALANGVAAHAMDYDLSFLSGQAVCALIPAILPVAETTGATPVECMAANIIGCEVAARIWRANSDLSNIGGWHSTGVIGSIAAAAACARLLKLPADKIADAIGISVSLASGIAANYGTMTKP